MPFRPARPVRPAAMLHDFGVVGQIGLNDEVKARQVDAAGGDVGCYADAGTPVPKRLERQGPLVLRQFAR
ncbi:hypothetical protein ABIE80_005061 [Bradyrhizobium diazoefficiens]